jgi:UDP-sugar diphosphatase
VSLQPDSKHAAPQLLSRLTSPVAQPLINGESKFIRTASLLFELDGRPRRWDVARSHPSVSELEGSEEERRKRKRTRRTTEEEKTHSFFFKNEKTKKKKVSVVIYHRERKSALVVRQFRPAVWAAALAEAQEEAAEKLKDVPPPPPLEAGLTFELCAGILDKGSSLEETAAEEVAEECGFRIDPSDLRRIASYHSAIGISGARHTVFAVSVDDGDALKEETGGGGGGGGGGVASDGEAIETLALPLASFDTFCADDSLAKSAGLVFGLGWLQKRLKSGEPIGMKV